MRQAGLAERYAVALYGAARDRQAIDAVAADVESLLAVLAQEPAVRVFFESPQVTEDHKHRLVDSLFGKRCQELTVRFLHLLLAKKRAAYLEEALREYLLLVERHRNVVRARVTVARPLTPAQSERLRRALEERTKHTVILESRVDREVLGGVIVQLGDQILDDSVRTRLHEIRDALLAAPL